MIVMKRMLFAVALCCAVVASSDAYAQKKLKDQEFRHVIVTLASGEKVDGYVHRDWNTSVFSVKKANYSFKLVPTPDSKEAVKYTAEQVDNIVFVEPTEGNPEGARWESRGLYNPIIGNMDRSTPTIMCVEKAGDNSTVYWWQAPDSDRMADGSTLLYISSYYGIRLDNDGPVYMFMKDGRPDMGYIKIRFKKSDPELGDYLLTYFTKGKEGKAHRKELAEDPTMIMRVYDEYIGDKK